MKINNTPSKTDKIGNIEIFQYEIGKPYLGFFIEAIYDEKVYVLFYIDMDQEKIFIDCNESWFFVDSNIKIAIEQAIDEFLEKEENGHERTTKKSQV